MTNFDNPTIFSSKPPAITIQSWSQLTLPYLQTIFQDQLVAMVSCIGTFFWPELAKKWLQGCFFCYTKLNSCRPRSLNQCFSWRFFSCKFLLKCPILCLLLRNKNLIRAICRYMHSLSIVLRTRLDFLKTKHFELCNHLVNQQTSICRT